MRRVAPVVVVEGLHVIGAQLVHALDALTSRGPVQPLDLHDARDADVERRLHEHVQTVGASLQDAVPAAAHENGVTPFGHVFDDGLRHAHELGVVQPQRRRNVVRRLEAAQPEQPDHPLDERVDALVLSLNVFFRHLVLRRDAPDDFLFPDGPAEPLAEFTDDQAAAAAVQVRKGQERPGHAGLRGEESGEWSGISGERSRKSMCGLPARRIGNGL